MPFGNCPKENPLCTDQWKPAVTQGSRLDPHDRPPSDPPRRVLGTWERLVGARGLPSMPTRRGRKPRVPLQHLLPALTFHVMQATGTLGEHPFQLFRHPLANSSWSDRPLQLPRTILAGLLRPARKRARAAAALPIKGATPALLGLGLHDPFTAAIGRRANPTGRGRTTCWRMSYTEFPKGSGCNMRAPAQDIRPMSEAGIESSRRVASVWRAVAGTSPFEPFGSSQRWLRDAAVRLVAVDNSDP